MKIGDEEVEFCPIVSAGLAEVSGDLVVIVFDFLEEFVGFHFGIRTYFLL